MPSKYGCHTFQNPSQKGDWLILSFAKVMNMYEEISNYTALIVLSPYRYFSNTIVQDCYRYLLVSWDGFFKFIFFHLLCVFVHVSVCTCMCVRVPLETRRERKLDLEAGVIGYCELPKMGTSLTLGWNGCLWCNWPNHLYSPEFSQ